MNEALPAELAEMRAKGTGPWSPEILEQDARRLSDFEHNRLGVPWQEIKSWMESWGTPNERASPKPRRL
jgi:hypothetical protein